MDMKNASESRKNILRAAEKAVCSDRNEMYGEPEENFQVIADLWNTYLFNLPCQSNMIGLTSVDVANMMILFKVGRACTSQAGGSFDTFADIAGYAACGGSIIEALEKISDI